MNRLNAKKKIGKKQYIFYDKATQLLIVPLLITGRHKLMNGNELTTSLSHHYIVTLAYTMVLRKDTVPP